MGTGSGHTVSIGDIGVVDGMMHIGDEAMFEQFLDQARARGVNDVVAISSNPSETAERYGIRSIPRLGLTGSRDEMLERAGRILAGDLPSDDPAHETLEAIATARRVVVTGAGNLASTWPVHIIEHWLIALLAERAGVPFVITGQTLGPELTASDAALLSEMLDTAALVGVREGASFRLADTLGVPEDLLSQQVDDASFLAIDRPTPDPGSSPYCLVSLSTHVGAADKDAFQGAVAALLDDIAARGLDIVFLAHFGPIAGDPLRGDVVMHEAVRSRMSAPSLIEPTGTSAEAAWLARRASLVVSSRYHPAVFAAAAGVPTLGIAVDEYTTVKLTGALGAFGQSGVIGAAELIAGEAPAAVARVRADAGTPGSAEAPATWWDSVVGA